MGLPADSRIHWWNHPLADQAQRRKRQPPLAHRARGKTEFRGNLLLANPIAGLDRTAANLLNHVPYHLLVAADGIANGLWQIGGASPAHQDSPAALHTHPSLTFHPRGSSR